MNKESLNSSPGLGSDRAANGTNLNDLGLDDMRAVFNAIALNTIEAIVLGDREGCVTFVNAATERLLGRCSSELIGEDIGSLFEQFSWDSLHKELQRTLNQGERIVNHEASCRHPTGRSLPVLCSIAQVAGGRNSEAIILTLRDLTEARRAARAEELLQRQADHEKAQFETILKQIPVGIVVAEASDGRITFCNEVAKSIFSEDELEAAATGTFAMTLAERLPQGLPAGPREPLARALFQGEVTLAEVVKVHDSSGRRFLAVNAAPIKNSSGEITSAVLAAYDISREREIQSDLKKAREEAERAALAKSSFLANVSHEIRTPLGAILGFTGLLKSGDIAPEETLSILDIIERNSQDLVRLIDEILDLSKVEAQKIEIERVSCPLGKLFDNVSDLLGIKAREKGISLTFERHGELPDLITTDPARLKQVLVNVVGNAIKFTERGGVHVKVRMLDSLDRDPAMMEICVTDSGIGISKEQARKLFQPFSQVDYQINRKFGGTGLGLAMSRKLAQLLGGNVELRESELSGGSVFVATVNVAPCAKSNFDEKNIEQASVSIAQVSHRRLEGVQVLAAEDSLDNQRLIKRILEKNGAHVELASDGMEAMAMAQNQDFDVVLMDIQMPHLDGYEATRQLRSLGYKKTIIALSAHALQSEREKSLLAGCNDHITKPLKPDHLVNRILDFVSCTPEAGNQGVPDVRLEQIQR